MVHPAGFVVHRQHPLTPGRLNFQVSLREVLAPEVFDELVERIDVSFASDVNSLLDVNEWCAAHDIMEQDSLIMVGLSAAGR